jgi:hypothetical protein
LTSNDPCGHLDLDDKGAANEVGRPRCHIEVHLVDGSDRPTAGGGEAAPVVLAVGLLRERCRRRRRRRAPRCRCGAGPAPAAALAAAHHASAAGRLVILDGAPADAGRAVLLAAADVVRADAHETQLLTGVPTDDVNRVHTAARDILASGPRFLALALETVGNLFLWRDRRWGEGALLLPLTREPVKDTTGAGDAFTAALLRGHKPSMAARCAVAAAGATVGHPGGRPNLTADTIRAGLVDLDDQIGPLDR